MDWLDKIITPRVGVVAIVESSNREKLLLIRRKFPPHGFAFPGGFVELGETVAQTAIREVEEETGIHIYTNDEAGLLLVTSATNLDPRAQFVVIAVVFKELFDRQPTPGDDALETFWTEWRTLRQTPFWSELTERSKQEYNEYCRWRTFAKDSEWRLSKLA